MNLVSAANIQKSIVTGQFKPNIYLTNLSVAQFQAESDFVAKKLFPIVPVSLPSSKYYKFSKADLARINMTEKPKFGKVTPAQWAQEEADYSCKVYQAIYGIDQIAAIPYSRTGAPGVADPKNAKARVAAEQTNLFMDVMFAEKFFKAGIWTQQYAGKTAAPGSNEFWQFDNSNSDPIEFFSGLIREMKREGRRKPNKLGLGANTFTALINNGAIKERVKYGGSTANPAQVNERVIAELLGLEDVVVLESTYNKASQGVAADMDFVCDPDGALLLYTPKAPAIDEPSAGYTFTWDMLGNGQPMAISNYLGEAGTHTEFVEALTGFDMQQVSKDLAIYLTDCTSK